MLNGLYNGNNIFNSNYFKFITSTLDLFKIISSNISKLDKIPILDVNNYNNNNKYPFCNNTTMIIYRHK